VAPDSGPKVPNRFAPLKDIAVLLLPPQARPVTVPLPPELVPPTVNKKFSGARFASTKSVSLAKRNTVEVAVVLVVAEKVRSSWGDVADPIIGLLWEVFTTKLYPKAATVKLIAPAAPMVSRPD